ncbi:50S ribosomal protein L9, partial [uncultured Microbacterium sp.]
MAKLILTNEVTGLGSAGDVVEVKNGYARNYLIPQGFAVAWSRGGEKQVASIRAARETRAIHDHEEAVSLKNSLESNTVKLAVKAGNEGRLFGSVKPADVADAVKAAGLGELDKRKIQITS